MNRCEQSGFKHAWEYEKTGTTQPERQHLIESKRRKCLNCGKEEQQVTIWREITN